MKKKIVIALTACLFAAGSIINMHLAQNHQNMDVSLVGICTTAQADGESECNLCVVKKLFITWFSCKPTPGINECSTEHEGATLSCDNATEC